MAESAGWTGINSYHAYNYNIVILVADMARIPKKIALIALASFIAGAAWLVMVRFIMYKSDAVHYHANFGVFIDGQREQFDSFTFYEEVASCAGDELNNPKTRVHMHDNVSHVVHVHDGGATWGHFFANLGYTLGNDVLKTDKGAYISGEDGKELRFILNGKETRSIANATIRNEDALLIDYGDAAEPVLLERFDAITEDAAEYNKRDDPSSCAGSQKPTFSDRLKKAIGF